MITVENLSLDFAGKPIFENVSLQIKPNDRIGLIGNNGAGKTTFLNLISDKETPSTGKIQLKNNTKIGYLPEEVYLNQDTKLKSLVLVDKEKFNKIEYIF